ncbi:phage integrase [Budvicia aquatica]|uniref:Integrase n=1 Tax=Budvicia aquatica TaxID=82979 RepID=A0A2C6BYL8_9GAMM|nr:tyrosine-type recombinase/integrase [Budvicia aquatica]PHI29220.1 integrase [Budvicia aquatica]VFS47429.1 Tyrosine recombinase XerC [Budvicia aquatica]
MAVRKLSSGKWLCECYPHGANGRRLRKQFPTKSEAMAYESHIMDQVNDKPWLGEKEDKRTLTDIVELWYNAHGRTLADGLRRHGAMLHICKVLGNPPAVSFSARDFSKYRELRLQGEHARTPRVTMVAPRTLNLELSYLRAMFNELRRLGEWGYDNPLKDVREFRTNEQEMAFLNHDQIQALLSECAKSQSKDLLTVVKIALATGARWGEAEDLTGANLTEFRVTFVKTKGKRNRSIPISQELYKSIPKKNGRLFIRCYDAFRSALKRTGIELPAGQLSHVLRHTFASHFMMGGGNILVLQRVLGHRDITMTMRYAHFAPDHLEDVVKLNPLENGDKMAIATTNNHS